MNVIEIVWQLEIKINISVGKSRLNVVVFQWKYFSVLVSKYFVWKLIFHCILCILLRYVL